MTDLDELERRAKAATPGPWEFENCYNLQRREFLNGTEVHPHVLLKTLNGWEPIPSDADFIAAANPQTVLALIAELRALREVAAGVIDSAIAGGRGFDETKLYNAYRQALAATNNPPTTPGGASIVQETK